VSAKTSEAVKTKKIRKNTSFFTIHLSPISFEFVASGDSKIESILRFLIF